MCGQYYCDASTFSFLEEDEEVKMSPGEDIPVLLYYEGRIIMTKLKWGYTLSTKKELIINARCETLLEKKIFKDDMLERRCVIPAKGFYQKDAKQHRISFESQKHHKIYMTGIYRQVEKEVVIITTDANEVMRPVHQRMPLIIPKDKVKQWLEDRDEAIKLLHHKTEDLEIVSGYLQEALFQD